MKKKSLFFSGKESTFYELDDVRHVAKKDPSDKNISMSEAMTQTDWQMFDRMGGFSDDLAANPPGPGQGTGKYKTLLPLKSCRMPTFLRLKKSFGKLWNVEGLINLKAKSPHHFCAKNKVTDNFAKKEHIEHLVFDEFLEKNDNKSISFEFLIKSFY